MEAAVAEAAEVIPEAVEVAVAVVAVVAVAAAEEDNCYSSTGWEVAISMVQTYLPSLSFYSHF